MNLAPRQARLISILVCITLAISRLFCYMGGACAAKRFVYMVLAICPLFFLRQFRQAKSKAPQVPRLAALARNDIFIGARSLAYRLPNFLQHIYDPTHSTLAMEPEM